MRVAVLGVGGTGGRVADAVRETETAERPFLTGVGAVDTDESALASLSLPEADRFVFGSTETGGAGTDGDRETGAEAASADRDVLRRAVEETVDEGTDAVLVVAGLGGGTGAAGAQAVADVVREHFDVPLFAVSVLPSTDASDALAANATAGLDALDGVVDAQLLFDNEAWLGSGGSGTGRSMATTESTAGRELDVGTRSRLNGAIAGGIEAVFAAGEATGRDGVGERVVDGRDVVETLSAGPYATLGLATESVRDPPSTVVRYLRENAPPAVANLLNVEADVPKVDAIKTMETTGRRALIDRRWAAVDPAAADRALIVFGGPPGWLYRSAVDNVRSWVENEVDAAQVRTGDAPRPYGGEAFVAVLVAGVDRPERFDPTG